MKNKLRKTLALSCALATAASALTVGGVTATASEAPAQAESDYTLTIPATLAVANSGWNATDGISATGMLATGKKLVVTASSDGEYALVSGTNKVNYKLAESGDNTTTYDTATEKTSWEFTALSETAATQPMGIVVEDYSTKPVGDYSDTVTFTAKVESAPITVTINQSDWGGWNQSFTKDGVTVSAGMIDPNDGNLLSSGTFSTTLGNFTKIEVTASSFTNMGSGWKVSSGKATWTGTASSTVSFGGSGAMDGICGMGNAVTMVFTIEE